MFQVYAVFNSMVDYKSFASDMSKPHVLISVSAVAVRSLPIPLSSLQQRLLVPLKGGRSCSFYALVINSTLVNAHIMNRFVLCRKDEDYKETSIPAGRTFEVSLVFWFKSSILQTGTDPFFSYVFSFYIATLCVSRSY